MGKEGLKDLRAIEPLGVDEVATASNTRNPRFLLRGSGNDDHSPRRNRASGSGSSGEQSLAAAASLPSAQEGRAQPVKNRTRSRCHFRQIQLQRERCKDQRVVFRL